MNQPTEAGLMRFGSSVRGNTQEQGYKLFSNDTPTSADCYRSQQMQEKLVVKGLTRVIREETVVFDG